MSGDLRKVCVIPARGGSKRLPRKNIVEFFGKPMIAHSIEAALNAKRFERVVVSSEDEEILEIAQRFGGEPVRRAPALASDDARVAAVLLDFLDIEEAEGRAYDVVCCLFAAAPMRMADDVAAVVDLIEPGQCDFAIAVTDFDLPPHQALTLGEGGALAPMWPDLVDMRDDEVGPLVVDNGSTYAAHVPAFRRQRNFYGAPSRGHRMARERSVDINTATDLEIARLYYQRLVVDAAAG